MWKRGGQACQAGRSEKDAWLLRAGIVPYINASIILQLLATTFPSLKKLQREEGPQVRPRARIFNAWAAGLLWEIL